MLKTLYLCALPIQGLDGQETWGSTWHSEQRDTPAKHFQGCGPDCETRS